MGSGRSRGRGRAALALDIVLVIQTINYEIKSEDSRRLVVNKSANIEIYKPDSTDPTNVIEYSGDFIFDKREKRVSRGDFDGHVTVKERRREKRIPISMSYWLS